MANTDVYVNKVTVPKGDGNTYTGILVDTASQKTWYGTSNTGATTQAKVVTCSGFYLQTGAIISVAFSTANTYTSAKITLNVNSTGAKDVYYNNAVTSSTNTLKWDAGEQVTFVYNGTGYYFVSKTKGYATSTYSSTGTDAVNGTAVNAALQTLDSSITATTGQAISAITITDGKISGSSKISVGEANLVTDVQINGTSILSSKVANLITNTAYNSSTNKIATMSDISDTKVTNTLATTTKYYVTGTTSSTTNTGTQSFDTGIYATTTAGQLNATTYKVNEQVTLQWNSTDQSLDFVF